MKDVLAVDHRFAAVILVKNVPSPLDIRFQRISGLGRELQTTVQTEGGDNTSTYHLPERVSQGRLVLERGVTLVSPLTAAFINAMTTAQPDYLTIVVMLMNHLNVPVCSWTCLDALPVNIRWGELDATSNMVLLNTLELECRSLLWMGAMA